MITQRSSKEGLEYLIVLIFTIIIGTFCMIVDMLWILFQGNLETSRPAFDAFLERYPYCYGYWKKYTDMEKKHAMFDEAEQVIRKSACQHI